MKTTINKLLKMGLIEDDVKKELGINDNEYRKLKKRNTPLKIDNVPEILEKYNGTKKEKNVSLYDSSDMDFAKILDSIYQKLGFDELDMTIKDKSDIVRNIPNFVGGIRKEIGLKKVKELELEIEKINEKIEQIKSKYCIYCIEKEEEDSNNSEEEKAKDTGSCMTFTFGKDLKMLSPNYELGKQSLMVRISKRDYEICDVGDTFFIYKDDSKPTVCYTYKVVDKKESTHKMKYIKLSLVV